MRIDNDGRRKRTDGVDVRAVWQRASIVTLTFFLGVAVVGIVASGCGSGRVSVGPSSPDASSIIRTSDAAAGQNTSLDDPSGTTGSEVPSSTGSIGTSPPASTAQEVFRDIAKWTAPAPAYGLLELPLGALISPRWWPVLSLASPSEWPGDVFANPRVMSGVPGSQEVQLILTMGDGWLVILENFRGDLGDVTGRPVGWVAGHEAWLYPLNGGVLVQWSGQGAWYGVFGRGLPADEVARVALSMRRVDGAD